jgi:hypothetical protein
VEGLYPSVTEDEGRKKEGIKREKRLARANCGSLVTPWTKKAEITTRPMVNIFHPILQTEMEEKSSPETKFLFIFFFFFFILPWCAQGSS